MNLMLKENNKTQKAFSLIELSAVLVIISVLLILSVPSVNNVNKNAKIKITNDRIKTIYQALGNFAQNQNRLPCPASLLLTKTDTNYGKEVTCGNNPSQPPADNSGVFQFAWANNLMYGMIPIKTLGLTADMAEDGFGNKLAYAVIKGYTNPATFGTDDPSTYSYNSYNNSTYVGQSCNKITISESKNSSYVQITSRDSGYDGNVYSRCNLWPNNNQAILVIISHGPNKFGGFPATKTSQDTASFSNSNFPAWDSTESANMIRIDYMSYSYTGPGALFYNYGGPTYTFVAASDDDSFDDIVFFKTIHQLGLDFNLKDAITCSTTASQSITYGSSTSFTWDGSTGTLLDTKYNTAVTASTTDCPTSPTNYAKRATRPTKRCGRFGLWDQGIREPCKN